MAVKKKAEKARLRGIPTVLKVLALCVLALIALLILLPAPPDLDAGGVTQVARHVPEPGENVEPLARATPPASENSVRAPEKTVAPLLPPSPTQPESAAVSVPANVPAPEPQTPVVIPAPVAVPTPEPEPAAAAPQQPAPQPEPTAATPAGPAPPIPARKPGGERVSAPPPPAQQDAPKRTLPWQIPGETAGLPPEPTPAPDASGGNRVPSASAIREWVKSQAWEFLGGVDAQGNILYRFEVWLEAPQSELKGIKSVAYEYDAPSATPKSRETDRADGGFRVRFGSLACSKKLTITLTMADGKKQQTRVDGCQVLN